MNPKFFTGEFYSHELFLGTIEYRDVTEIGMDGIAGVLRPNENYRLIRPQILEFNDLEKRSAQDYVRWQAMNFNIRLENGYFIQPAGGYLILDSDEFPDEPVEIHAPGVHSHIYGDFLAARKTFMPAPWRAVDISEKLALEKRYRDETGLVKKLSFFYNYLREPEFSALGCEPHSERALFSVLHTKRGCFALVDFRERDEKGNPAFCFFAAFDEFIELAGR